MSTKLTDDSSCLFIKRREQLTQALSINPAYLRNASSDSGAVIDYRDWQISLSRRFRALKIWFVMRTYGVNGFKKYIRQHVRLGEGFAKMIASKPHLFQIITPPAFALTVLSVRPENDDREEANRLTRAVYESINQANEIMLTSTVIGGYFVIRVVGANPKTDAKALQRAFDALVFTAEQTLWGFPTIARELRTESSSDGEMVNYEVDEDVRSGGGGKEMEWSQSPAVRRNILGNFSLWSLVSKMLFNR